MKDDYFGLCMFMLILIAILTCFQTCSLQISSKPIKDQAVISQRDRDLNKLEPLLDAIEHVEGWDRVTQLGIRGERGPYQITKDYWIDSRIPGDFEDCDIRSYAKEVVLAYMYRYCPEAIRNNDYETIARIHNGGPLGATKFSTKQYWYRVFFYMDRKLEEGLTK